MLTKIRDTGRTGAILAAAMLAAGVAGVFVSGYLGQPKAPSPKMAVTAIPLAEPFTINLTDRRSDAFVRLAVAVQLEPMEAERYAIFMGTGGGGHGGGSTEPPGPAAVSSYAKLRNAIIEETSLYSSTQLLTPAGKERLKRGMLDRFHAIAEVDKAEADSATVDPEAGPIAPPYRIEDVHFQDFAIQR